MDYQNWIGKSIVKKSKKPFQSGNKIGTVVGIEINPQSPNGELGFKMKEDDSIVNCKLCKLAVVSE